MRDLNKNTTYVNNIFNITTIDIHKKSISSDSYYFCLNFIFLCDIPTDWNCLPNSQEGLKSIIFRHVIKRGDCKIISNIIILKYLLSQKWPVTEASKQCTSLISDWWIIITPWVLGLSRNLFHILRNIPTVIGIMNMGNSLKCRIYARFIIIDIHIYTKTFCGGGGWQKRMTREEDVVEAIKWSLVQILALF